MAKKQQIKEEDYTPAETRELARAEVLLRRKGNKYRPVPKFKGGCKDC